MRQHVHHHANHVTGLLEEASGHGSAAKIESDVRQLQELVDEGQKLLPRLERAGEDEWPRVKQELDRKVEAMGRVFAEAASKLN
jgi:hypothetical protein